MALRGFASFLLSFALFFPYFLDELGSLRFAVVVIGVVAFAIEIVLGEWTRRQKTLWLGIVVVGIGALVGVIELIARIIDDRFFAVNAEHLFVLLPLFALLGCLIFRSDGARVYLLVFLSVAALVSVMAVAESLLDHSLLGRDDQFLRSQREGLTRALVGSEHVLVLGATLATAVPLTLKLERVRYQLAMSLVLVIGCWATGSRAPALICTAVAVVQAIPLLRRLIQRFVWVIQAAAALVVIALAVFSVAVWKPYIPGATGLEFSANYRWASYSLLPQILLERPLGTMLGGAPTGLWMVDSELRGPVDIGKSADSEIVFSIFVLGWLGLALFLVALFVAIAAIKHDLAIGLAATTMTAIGFILALHGWDAMSPFWYALMGMSAYLVVRARRRKRTEDASAEAVSADTGAATT